jgi:hypothetical protein
MIDEATRKQLNADIPAASVTQRTQAGQKLDYVEAWWVIDRLNQILGNGAWGSELVTHEHVCTVDNPEKHNATVTYRAVVRLFGAFEPMMGVGFASNTSKSLGDAHETAGKSAESDALKRAAMKLGRHLGLALYQKPDKETGERTYVAPAAPTRLADCASAANLQAWIATHSASIADRDRLTAAVKVAAAKCKVDESQAMAWMGDAR